MRVGHLDNLCHARGRTYEHGDEEMIRDQVGKECVLAAPAAVVGTVEDVCDVATGVPISTRNG